MIEDSRQRDHYYDMLIEKNSQYEGIFYVGVKTTGVFCRPTCPAKKPLKKIASFFRRHKKRCWRRIVPANDVAHSARLATYPLT